MFENVRVGDYVKITGKNGDVAQGEVMYIGTSGSIELSVFDEGVYVLPEEADSFVIVKRPYEPGLYVTPTLPRSILRYNGKRWVQIVVDSGDLNHNFDPELFNDLEKIELPEYMYL